MFPLKNKICHIINCQARLHATEGNQLLRFFEIKQSGEQHRVHVTNDDANTKQRYYCYLTVSIESNSRGDFPCVFVLVASSNWI